MTTVIHSVRLVDDGAVTDDAWVAFEGDTVLRTGTGDAWRALPAVEGQAGIKSSTGKITPPVLFKGVSLLTLIDQVGGLGADMGVEIEAEDGYIMTFSGDQLANGAFIAYDPATGDELKSVDPLTVIVAYEMDGQPLDEQRDGKLRLAIISEKNNQVTDGHWSIKWVRRVTLKSMAEDWVLELQGAIDDPVDRGSYESCSASGCHGSTWTDTKAQEWSGTPLWIIVGRVDDEFKHGSDVQPYNRELAEAGAGDGSGRGRLLAALGADVALAVVVIVAGERELGNGQATGGTGGREGEGEQGFHRVVSSLRDASAAVDAGCGATNLNGP